MRSMAARGSLSLCLKLSLMPFDIRRCRTPVVASGGGCDGPCKRAASRVRPIRSVDGGQVTHMAQSFCCRQGNNECVLTACSVEQTESQVKSLPEHACLYREQYPRSRLWTRMTARDGVRTASLPSTGT